MTAIQAELTKKFEEYREKFDSPTAETLKRWEREAARKAANKNQMVFEFARVESQ